MLYNVVIIDDNSNTVQSLVYGIEWNELGLKIVGTAFDGQQGKKLIEETRPDIIITDIHMPHIDGLSMVEQALTLMPDSKVIVITGYDSVQYATRAIKLSVFDYIFKPIDNDELLTALRRAVKVIKESKSSQGKQDGLLRARLISGLLLGHDLTVKEVLKSTEEKPFCAMFMGSVEEGISQALFREVDYSEIISKNFHLTVLIEEKLALLCLTDEVSKDWEKYLEDVTNYLISLAPEMKVGRSKTYPTDTFSKKIYWEAYENMLIPLAKNQEKSTRSQSQNHTSVADMQAETTKLAEDISGSADYEKTYEIFKRCTSGSLISLQIMTIMYCTKVIQTHKQWAEALDPIIYGAPQNMTLDMFSSWLKAFLEAIDQIQKGSKGKSKLVSKVLRYMEEHALENQKLEQVAEAFYVSPNYLSSLIRKETGITFQQHVLKNKIEISKRLLDDTRMRVEEIAHMIGYENYVSFYNIFKRLEGITPSEYRFRRKD